MNSKWPIDKIKTEWPHQSNTFQVWEPHIHSFVEVCPPLSNHLSGSDDQTSKNLEGITVGVKDIIDVKGVPTRNGSAVCKDDEPAIEDASVVAALRSAGVNVIGKTTTTEFAFTDPTNCRNPHNINRTPGGSSSGSGAAVAAGLVDMALGTQTAGSLCRPAAYCGVVGFKPSYGVLSTHGVTPLAKSFDTVGLIARTVEIASKGFFAIADNSIPSGRAPPVKLNVVSALLPTQLAASNDVMNAFVDAAKALTRSHVPVSDIKISAKVSDIVAAHRVVMNAEAAQAHQRLLQPNLINLLQPKFRAALESGSSCSQIQLDEARMFLVQASNEFWLQLSGIDILLTLPVPDGAPLMDGTTGFQDWLTPWTVFGGPLVCVPWGLDSLGRPRSIMLAAHPGQDRTVLAMAAQLESLAPAIPPPTIPESQF